MRILLPALAAVLTASIIQPAPGSAATRWSPGSCIGSAVCTAMQAGNVLLAAGHGGGMGGGGGGMGGTGGGMGGGTGGGMGGGTGGGMGGTGGGMGGGSGMGTGGSGAGSGSSAGSLNGERHWYQCVTPFGRCSYAASGSPSKGDSCYCASAQSPGKIE